jgi:hypothetical protein
LKYGVLVDQADMVPVAVIVCLEMQAHILKKLFALVKNKVAVPLYAEEQIMHVVRIEVVLKDVVSLDKYVGV